MVELLSLTHSRTGDSVVEKIEFDPIPLTEDDESSVWVQNEMSNQPITITNVSVTSEGSGEVSVTEQPEMIPADGAGELRLRAKAIETEQLSGISANVTIEAESVVTP